MPDPLERAGGRVPRALLVFLGLCAPALAQKEKAPEAPPAVDPYTGGDPRRLEALGYRSFGPFRFGTTSSEIVQALLGDVPIQWVETESFRIGSALTEYRVEESEEAAELRLELEDLRGRLAAIPVKARKLDPWLRLHLFARRLERLHADFGERLGLDAQAGAAAAANPRTEGKFTVLLTQKRSTLARFTAEYCGREQGDAVFHAFPGSFFFGVSDESVALGDSDLHYALVYGVVQNLLMAVNGFPHVLPTWWQNGLALWFAREREPRLLLYSRPDGELLPPRELADWEPLVRGRVEAGACMGWSEMLARPSWINQPFGENVVLWSRIDYLLRHGKAPVLVRELHDPDRPTPDSQAALALATGLELGDLDRAWQAWVRESYRKKRK